MVTMMEIAGNYCEENRHGDDKQDYKSCRHLRPYVIVAFSNRKLL